jgi:hypothetical protein
MDARALGLVRQTKPADARQLRPDGCDGAPGAAIAFVARFGAAQAIAGRHAQAICGS